jgi:hypothetical protein
MITLHVCPARVSFSGAGVLRSSGEGAWVLAVIGVLAAAA